MGNKVQEAGKSGEIMHHESWRFTVLKYKISRFHFYHLRFVFMRTSKT